MICVGTTSCRTVESAAEADGHMKACSGNTDIFIYPGYKFKVMDGLITNFHLPESTLVMLVSAFAGRDHVLKAYEEAVKEKYRFSPLGMYVYRRSEQRRGARRVGFYERGKEFLSIKSIKSKVGKCLTDCLWAHFPTFCLECQTVARYPCNFVGFNTCILGKIPL